MSAIEDPAEISPFASEGQHGPRFLQHRLRIMLRVLAVGSWSALVAHLVVTTLEPRARSGHPLVILACFVTGCVFFTAGAWLVGPARPRSFAQLHVIDAVLILFVSAVMAVMIFVPTGRIDEVYLALFTNGLLTVGRSLFIPTSTRRTLWLAGSCGAITFGATALVALASRERLTLAVTPFIVNNLFVAAFPAVLATASSRVIAGLRAQVREAQRLGRYTLGAKIGEGGMGAVFRAEHAFLRRPTAIKLLPSHKTSAATVRLFEREVQLTAQLTGPNIISIFDYGRAADGTFYYAMEFVDGVDLETLVNDFGAQPAGRVIHLLRQVCDALEEAHGCGLIHRDIKPANILLCERGTKCDVVKVVDFGLVKELAGADGTADGSIQGTPGYLAPEAIYAPATVGASGDLYALGAVAYFLLTGSRLFEGKTFEELCDHHLHTRPVPPSRRTTLPIPPALDRIVMACVAKEPGDRPASAVDLRARLAELAEVIAWTSDDAEAWWRRFRRAPVARANSALASDPTERAVVDAVGKTISAAEAGARPAIIPDELPAPRPAQPDAAHARSR